MREKYMPLVDRVTSRAELSDLLGQLVSELSALHIFVGGGDFRTGRDDVKPAFLGAELEPAENGWRVARLYRGDPDEPDRLAPLARPDVDVHEGDVLVRVDGVATKSVVHPAMLLRGKAGAQVLLEVAPMRKVLELIKRAAISDGNANQRITQLALSVGFFHTTSD